MCCEPGGILRLRIVLAMRVKMYQILHPTPFTLHPTPYTLHRDPTPNTLLPTPYSLLPKPYIVNPKPAELCKEKGVKGFPTWEINGKMYPGEKSLADLAKLSNFSPPSK